MRTFSRFFLPVVLFMVIASGTAMAASDDILGFWKQIDDKTQLPETLVYIYNYQGKLYGRMIISYEDNGAVKDTILVQKFKAEKLAGDPPYCGLDYVYQLEVKGKEYRGGIMDPRSGDDYTCVIKRDGEKLIVRGQLKGLGLFGRNQTWVRASAADLPAGFAMPDPALFIPVLPKKK